MKTFLIGLLLGIIIGGGTLWYLGEKGFSPTLDETEKPAPVQPHTDREPPAEMTREARQFMAGRLEALQLRAEDIREELAEHGRIVRRRARDLGETVSDAARDARATATIKARLAADPQLSALRISVSTTDGRVVLAGTVGSTEEIGRAVALALATEGVHEVFSTLQVKTSNADES